MDGEYRERIDGLQALGRIYMAVKSKKMRAVVIAVDNETEICEIHACESSLQDCLRMISHANKVVSTDVADFMDGLRDGIGGDV